MSLGFTFAAPSGAYFPNGSYLRIAGQSITVAEQTSPPPAGSFMVHDGTGGVTWQVPPASQAKREPPKSSCCDACQRDWKWDPKKTSDGQMKFKVWTSYDGINRILCYDCIFDGAMFSRHCLNAPPEAPASTVLDGK